MVICFHYQFFVARVAPSDRTHLPEKLYLMVDLFFVLSGFIMYYVYGNAFRQNIPIRNVKQFMGARFGRIYPLHLFTLLYLLVLYFGYRITDLSYSKIYFDTSAIPSQLFLLQAMGTHHEATWNVPSWSISVEWWTYFLFPVLILMLAKTKSWSRWLLGLVIIAGYLSLMYYYQPEFWRERWQMLGIPESVPFTTGTIDVITGSALIRCICGFIYGLLIFEAYKKELGKKFLHSGWVFTGLWLILFVLWHFDFIYDIVAVFVFGLIILSVLYNTDWLGKFINNKFFEFLGNISYSIYLVHMPLIFTFLFFHKLLGNSEQTGTNSGLVMSYPVAFAGLLVLVALTIGVAYLTYTYIEKPARNRVKKLIS